MTNTAPNDLTIDALAPMDAVKALYGPGQEEQARAIVASLNHGIFEGEPPKPSGLLRRAMAHGVVRLMKRTTRAETQPGPDGRSVVVYRNRILERTRHPYVITMLEPSRADTASFVEGGDPMNAIYMLICPEVAKNAGPWDKIILDSVQCRDVQWRFVWETRLTHALASRQLKAGQPVRIKGVAAGAGLSLILVLEKLLQEGHDPRMIRVMITDREASNIEKATRLVSKVPGAGGQLTQDAKAPHGLSLRVEDALSTSDEATRDAPYDVVTLLGLLEYFPGFTFVTSEEHLGEPAPHGPPWAQDVVANVATMTKPGGSLITNSYRAQAAARLLETFGKRFRYRGLKELEALVATGGFVPSGTAVSANIFDVEVFEKKPEGRS